MGKFKVGDRVRPKRTSSFLNIAETYEVSGIAPPTSLDWVWLKGVQNLGSHDGSFREDYLELIEPDAATDENWDFDPRRELRVGDRVKARGYWESIEGEGAITQIDGDAPRYRVAFSDSDALWCDEVELLPPAAADLAEPDSDISVRVVADMSQLDCEIDRILRRLKKVKKKARKLGIRMEFRDAA